MKEREPPSPRLRGPGPLRARAAECYARGGAYHWRDVGGHWIYHNAFTAERYRRTLDAAEPLHGSRALDYGCGDGAFLAWMGKRVGSAGELHGFDPDEAGLSLAALMLEKHRVAAKLHSRPSALPSDYFDRVVCAEVIEHVEDPGALIAALERILKPGGRAVVTTPIRLTEHPEDPRHVREWFPGEFRALCANGGLRVTSYEQFIPAAAPEVFFWRPPFFFRVPIFRVLCNLLSIYGGVNALSWLRMRPRYFMTQLVVLEKP